MHKRALVDICLGEKLEVLTLYGVTGNRLGEDFPDVSGSTRRV